MSTIRGQNLDAAEEIRVAAEAGYDAIEPWLGKLEEYVKGGGKLTDLRMRLEDGGLTVESAIGFANWIVDDDSQRAKGFEQAKRDMDVIAQLGGKRIAAAPAGAPGDRAIDPMKAAERYRQLLELGDELGVVPQIEMWGGNKSIGRVSTAIFIAMEAAHPKACFLGDVYHTYKGGSEFASLLQLGPQALQTFHMNDYPADPPRETIRDEHRVYPGDGIAPLSEILRGFRRVGANPVLNLELFNRDYWKLPALEVAKTGLAKMKAAVAAAGL
ncbi:MAG: sugar phosphate isomerase/epimerase [Verrucomicrobiota bacterium]